MSTIGGNNSVQDGLVFHYDTGNKRKSFLGEPTENVIIYTNLDNGWNKGYTSTYEFNTIDPPLGINSQVLEFTDVDSSGYWYSYGDYAPQVPGETYVVSLYVKTEDPNFRLYFYTADNNEVGRYVSEIIAVPNDGTWHRIVWNSFLNPVDSVSESLSFKYYCSTNTNLKTWFCAPQMEPNTHATPFTPTQRTATESLLDLTGNTPIDVSNVSFDEQGMFFDGIENHINLGPNDNWGFGGNGAMEMVLNPSNSDGNNRLWCVNNNNYSLDAYLNSSSYQIYMHGGVVGTTTSLTQNNWNHVIVTYTNGIVQIYINGLPVDMIGTTTGYNISNNGTLYIGRYTSSGFNIGGELPITKIYNKALTPQEVKRNFQAVRGRFGI